MGAEGEERAGNNFPICTWKLFGAGLLTPPTPFRGPGRTAGLPTGAGLETSGRPGPRNGVGKVRRPCHNLVRDCEKAGNLFRAFSEAVQFAGQPRDGPVLTTSARTHPGCARR